jgi:hypothetical protein
VEDALATTCSGGRCGTQTNNCGKPVACPATACSAPQSCGGGGTANQCGGCHWATAYPPATGCAFAPGFGDAFTWPCYTPAVALGPGNYNLLTLCGDDVIVDTRTKLMWARREELPASWENAKATCAVARHAGFSDWRLPKRQELVSLVDYTKSSTPVIDTTMFQGVNGGLPANASLWSSSANAMSSSGAAWLVDFRVGSTGTAPGKGVNSFRCVR